MLKYNGQRWSFFSITVADDHHSDFRNVWATALIYSHRSHCFFYYQHFLWLNLFYFMTRKIDTYNCVLLKWIKRNWLRNEGSRDEDFHFPIMGPIFLIDPSNSSLIPLLLLPSSIQDVFRLSLGISEVRFIKVIRMSAEKIRFII